MGRIRNTIELAKTSWGVLQKDRELVVLPVLSFLGAALVLAAFVLANRAIGRVTGAIFLLAYLAFVWLVF